MPTRRRGNDARILLSDLREAGRPSVTLEDCHARAINFLEFSPSDPQLLLSGVRRA